MATTLEEHQFEILNEDADSGVAFGIGLGVSVDAAGFDPGTNDWLVQDQEDPNTGATRTGRDVRTGSTFTWSMHVNESDVETALASLDELADIWAPDDLESGEVMVVRYRVGDRVRRVYGRPRRWGQTPDNRILNGMIPVTADFKRVSPLFFDDGIESVNLGLSYTSEGGFIFPVTFPVMTLPGGFTPGEAHVSGRRKTWPIIRVNGPVSNPEIQAQNWTLKLTTTIADGDWIEIDTRPWKKTIINSSGGAVPGVLSAQTSLRNLFLLPGHQSFGMRGVSGEGTGNCTISWYPAYASL